MNITVKLFLIECHDPVHIRNRFYDAHLKEFYLDSIKHNHKLPFGKWFVFKILYTFYFG